KDINPYQTVIKVLGAGGAGTNTIHHLTHRHVKEISTAAINTDAQDLLDIYADRKILIGREITKGLGAGGDPEIGERSAEESQDVLKTVIEGTDILFLTCGLGGGTGTGSVPYVSGLAKDQGILTVAIVTMPFSEEGIVRWENAQIGLEKLRKNVDTLMILKNDKLVELYPDLPLAEAFRSGDEILINALIGMTDMILSRGLINLDFADISAVMRDGPNAVIGLGESSSENRVEEAVRRAISHPMMKTDISGAQSVLIHVLGGPTMTMGESHRAIKLVSERLDTSARVIWGATVDERMDQTLRVLLVVSGLMEKEVRRFDVSTDRNSERPGDETDSAEAVKSLDNGRSIFDIKESILSQGSAVSPHAKPVKPLTQTTLVFYKIFEEEAVGDLKRFDRAVHLLRKTPQDRRALLDAKQSCKLLHASALMFGFDEIGQLLASIEEIMSSVQSRELEISAKILDSITLAMEMVVDLIENRSDGRGETGYIVDRLKELKIEQQESYNQDSNLNNY
ncbi:cell division protein FtsZ, partial [bacterium I07]